MNIKLLIVIPGMLFLSGIAHLISYCTTVDLHPPLKTYSIQHLYTTVLADQNTTSILTDQNATSILTDQNATSVDMHPPRETSSPLQHLNTTVLADLYVTSDQFCRDGNLCLQYLTLWERLYYVKCTQRAKMAYGKAAAGTGTCRFMNGTGRKPVALVSFPGSGNTWVRGLLEKATGICTGGVYCDHSMRASGFRGESVRGASVLVVKTHKLPTQVQPSFSAAVVLVRNPRGALVAEWQHRTIYNESEVHYVEHMHVWTADMNSHVLSLGKEYFGTNKEWNSYLRWSVLRWKDMIKLWADFGKSHPLHVVYYEDLKTNATAEVEKMLTFLRVPYSPAEVARRLEKDFTDFHRTPSDDFQHYTPEQETDVRQAVVDILEELQRTGMDTKFSHIQRYL